MKRFYTLVTTKESDQGYEILLDGKPVKTPAKNMFCAPNEALANLMMQEWAEQGEEIKPETMPLTQFVSTKIDRVSQERANMQDMVLKYFDTDLLCYRTDHPEELGKIQAETWDTWLTWFEGFFGFTLETTTAISALSHDKLAQKAVQDYVASLDEDRFTLLQIITPLCGSIILAMAFIEDEASAEEVFQAARVEERYKAVIYDADTYGPDPMQDKKDKAAQRDLSAAQDYLQTLKF